MGGKYKYKMNDMCKIEGCNFSARVKGYCSHCYERIKYKQRYSRF
jgi:hypothetical protein